MDYEKYAIKKGKQDLLSSLIWVFIYENNGHYSYYIPTEIKKIIKNELNL